MISVIIPTFGSRPRLTKLFNSIAKYENHDFEVIVINDNPNVKFSAFVNASIKIIYNEQNLGFSKSVNKGLKAAKGDILLLCNDDIIFTKSIFPTIEKEFTNDPHLGILGALLRYPRGGVQHAGIELDPVKKLFYHKRTPVTEYIIAVTGALFAISRAAYTTLGGLDESYFLACEDTKYCLDAWDKDIRVKVSKEVTAIHEEGATRGRNDMQKRRFPEWTRRELDGIGRFQKTLSVAHIQGLEKKIKILNKGTPIKLEIGSGHNPQPGYKHLDVRSDLPEVDYVCDITKSKLPFEDGQVSEILTNHVIEHIPFRLLPFVLGEWSRVLSPEGKLILRTPNLRFIMEKYLAGEITPEHPGDEAFIKRNLSDKITPAWWANLKLFSGQDYAANFHHVCFDFEMLANLLEKYGFGHVEETKFEREYSPGELQVIAYKQKFYEEVIIKGKFATVEVYPKVERAITEIYKEIEKTPKPKSCLVRRDIGLGDVLLTTPIIERLYEQYKIIDVITQMPDVFRSNPYVRGIAPFDPITWPNLIDLYDRVINLNLAYERQPDMHIVDGYSWAVFADMATPHKIKLYGLIDDVPQNEIVIHGTFSWENRTWAHENWEQVSEYLLRNGEILSYIGNHKDYYNSIGMDFRSKQSFWEMVNKIKNAKLFIGFDSGPLHIAQAVGTPSIGLFSCAKAEYRTTGKNILTVIPDIECYGCLHDEKPPVTYCGCRRGDLKCLSIITPSMVIAQYEKWKSETAIKVPICQSV